MTPDFTDMPDFAAAEVAKAKYNGILDGKTATTFDPYSNATRGQVCKMVSNLLEKIAKGAVVGTSTAPSADFTAMAARLNAVLALGYNTTNPDVVAKALMDGNAGNDPGAHRHAGTRRLRRGPHTRLGEHPVEIVA